MTAPGQYANVRYVVDDVQAAGGRQILLTDPAGNLIELFQPVRRPASPAEAS